MGKNFNDNDNQLVARRKKRRMPVEYYLTEKIQIDNNELFLVKYKEQRVLTAQQIAKMHEKETRQVNEAFRNNLEKFELGEDYFKIDRIDLEFSHLFTSNNQDKLFLFSESGYLNLCKIFNDDISWNVFKKLKKAYFIVKEIQAKFLEDYISKSIFEELLKQYKFLENDVDEQDEYIKQILPLAEYTISVSNSKNGILVEDFSCILEPSIGRNLFYTWLREQDYIKKYSRIPYRRWIEMGIFEVMQNVVIRDNYEQTENTTLITSKGQIYLEQKWREYNQLQGNI